ncbi:hypothetical protein CYMTET_52666 [Cymbomonas tetramitiformis]|uniref:Uncharacterized protein n=1 Tax=Cymbomonas tetramitiformis TaxID=36881 RepID=A0AAE0BKB0_9CHLO|nr:hypothetical protein CYMTET_52666 [Cymbomonas tetramitiformis]
MKADPRKGKIQVTRAEDTLLHFRWLERTSIDAEEDVIVFPGEAVFTKMPNGRCFLLKFDGQEDRNLFFWMQETNAEGDGDLLAAVNLHIGAEEPNVFTQMDTDSTADSVATAPAQTPQQAPTQLQAEAVAVTPAAAAAAMPSPAEPTAATTSTPSMVTPAATGSASLITPSAPRPAAAPSMAPPSAVSQEALQSILSGMLGGEGRSPGPVDQAALAGALAAAAGGMGGMGGMQQQVASGPSLAEVLKPEVLLPLATLPGLQERLTEFLPAEHRHSESIASLVQSPQFCQQIETFSRALQTGQIDLAQFGLDPSTGFSAAEFLQAIETQVGNNPNADDAMKE